MGTTIPCLPAAIAAKRGEAALKLVAAPGTGIAARMAPLPVLLLLLAAELGPALLPLLAEERETERGAGAGAEEAAPFTLMLPFSATECRPLL